jgi:hypothetical protein
VGSLDGKVAAALTTSDVLITAAESGDQLCGSDHDS